MKRNTHPIAATLSRFERSPVTLAPFTIEGKIDARRAFDRRHFSGPVDDRASVINRDETINLCYRFPRVKMVQRFVQWVEGSKSKNAVGGIDGSDPQKSE